MTSASHQQNGHSLCRRVVWSTVRIDANHAGAFDAVFFAQSSDFLVCAIEFGLEPDAGVDAVGSPTAGVGRGKLSQRDHMEYCQTGLLLPLLGKRDSWRLIG